MMTDILIVDDSLTVRMALVDTLEEAGFTCRACATGAEARKALTEGRYLLAILDQILPDDDGIDLLKLIREKPDLRDMAVIMLSGEAEVQHRIRGLAAGADDYIGKPYDSTYLVGRARDHVRRLGGAVSHAGQAILLIDDSITFRTALQEMLEEAGYDTLLAESGEEGLRIAADERPAAIIVDGALPGIDGATVIRRIRLDAALRQTPCLMVTGSVEAADELQALDAGADAYVRKGEESAIILARLKALLRGAVGWESKPSPDSLQAPKRVLAVDDDPVYLHQLSRMLQGEGFEVQLAPSGEEALQLLSLQPVDCLVLDLHMPGIDGLETCQRLKAAPGLRDVPVIMLTGSEDRRSMIAGYGAGADDFLTKSNDAEVLRARVLSQIRRKQGQEETRRIREELLRRELEAAEERAARQAAEERAAHAAELELKNQELEAFSYSVAHDLRAPLRGIDGFSLALLEDYGAVLDEAGKKYLAHIRNSTVHMARLIEDLLKLSKVTRSEFLPGEVDLSAIAQSVVGRLRDLSPDRKVEIEIEAGLTALGDPALLMIALENLLGNAWKFTAKQERPHISFRAETHGRSRVFVVRDNGAGFDMERVGRLFNVFTRLHSAQDFEGTGIGLATTLRVVRRHGGKIWAEGEVGKGAAFFFTLEAKA
jgi:DNA-binding response OmpR family regulator